MRTLLLAPRLRFRAQDVVKPDGSLALPYLAGGLRERGLPVEIVDCSVGTGTDDLTDTFYRKRDVGNGMIEVGVSDDRLAEIVRGYDVIGITSIFTMQTSAILAMLAVIREANPRALIVMGGVNARSWPLRVRFHEAGVSHIACGEADWALAKLIRDEPYANWHLASWLPGVGGRPEVVTDLDDLPMPAWDLMPNDRYWQISRPHGGDFPPGERVQYASLMTSRGCPFSCLAGDTPINTVEGDVPIRDLVGREDVGVYTYDPATRRAFITRASKVWRVGERELVRVTFDDGTHIDCTPDHRFLTFKNGHLKGMRTVESETEARHLRPKQSVRALKFETDVGGYRVARWARRDWDFAHRMVAEYVIGRELTADECVHHVDHDKQNNLPGNLRVMTVAEHAAEHCEQNSERMRGEKNPVHRMPREVLAERARTMGKRPKSLETRRRMSEAARGEQNPNFQHGGSVGLVTRLVPPKGKRTVECRQRMREAKLGANNPNYKHGKSTMGSYSRVLPEINHKVVSVEPIGFGPVYDMEVPATHWFFANHVLVHNCSYCHISKEGDDSPSGNIGAFRVKSRPRVRAELANLKALGVEWIFVEDDSLLAKKKRALDLMEDFAATGLRFADVNGVNLAHLVVREGHGYGVDRGLLRALRQAGFEKLTLPFESGSQRILDVYASRKWRTDIVPHTKLVEACREEGITPLGNYTIGYPDESLDEMLATIQMAKEHVRAGLAVASFFCIVPFPGTKLFDDTLASGALSPDWSPDTMNWTMAGWAKSTVPADTINAIRRVAWEVVNDPTFTASRKQMAGAA